MEIFKKIKRCDLFNKLGRARLLAASLFALVVMPGITSARADGTMSLIFKAKRASPVCTLSSDKTTVTVPRVQVGDIQQNTTIGVPGPGGATFRLTIGTCSSLPGVAQAKIAVYGDRDGTSGNYGFRSASSTSSNAGFAFRYNAQNGNQGSWVQGGAPPSMTTSTNALKLAINNAGQGVSPAGKTMDFWVGVTTGGYYTPTTLATAGTLTANMHFDLIFE